MSLSKNDLDVGTTPPSHHEIILGDGMGGLYLNPVELLG